MSGVRLEDLFIGILPMLLLIGAWAFFMWRMQRSGSPQDKWLAQLQRQADALERIAVALEKRP